MARSRILFAVAVALSSSALMLGAVPTAHAADPPKCEPDKLAAVYPGLVGKKVIIGQDGESPPYSFRDPKNFNNIIGADADMARAAFKCHRQPVRVQAGRLVRPAAGGDRGPRPTSCGTTSTTRPSAPSRSTTSST